MLVQMNFGTNGFSPKILFSRIEKHLEHNLHLFKIQDVIGDKIDRPFAPFRMWTLDKDLFFLSAGLMKFNIFVN